MKRSLRSITTRSTGNIHWILPILISTVQTFYFEIDREDDFRRKGPSKENRKDPIVGMGLLLDAHQIPIGMKLYPGNESEKPVIREVIDDLEKPEQHFR